MATDLSRKESLTELTDKIVATYEEIGTINHLGHSPLPSPDSVIEITNDLVEILYPGYKRRQNLNFSNVVYHVGDLVDSLHDRLTQQISRTLRHEYQSENEVDYDQSKDIDFEAEGQRRAILFLESIPRIREYLALDVQAAFDGDPAAQNLDEIIFCYPGLEAITVQRLAHELYRLEVPMIPRMMCEWAHNRTGIDIHPGARIGPSFFIDHGTGVVIGETTDIAANVKIYQGVTLGAVSFPRDADGNIIRGAKRHPTIEQGVVIYANATVLGGETVIGANSIVGASVSLFNERVPANTLVTVEKPSLRYKNTA